MIKGFRSSPLGGFDSRLSEGCLARYSDWAAGKCMLWTSLDTSLYLMSGRWASKASRCSCGSSRDMAGDRPPDSLLGSALGEPDLAKSVEPTRNRAASGRGLLAVRASHSVKKASTYGKSCNNRAGELVPLLIHVDKRVLKKINACSATGRLPNQDYPVW